MKTLRICYVFGIGSLVACATTPSPQRASSDALRNAEIRACAGVSPEDRDTSPFEHAGEVNSILPLYSQGSSANQLIGATVTIQLASDMTAERFQRLMDCSLARNTALGRVASDALDCPILPKGAQATVSPAPGGTLAVEIRSSDLTTARGILACSQRLGGRWPG